MEFIYKNVSCIYSESEIFSGGPLKCSRLIYCGPGLVILTVELVQNQPHNHHLFWLLLEGKSVVYPKP